MTTADDRRDRPYELRVSKKSAAYQRGYGDALAEFTPKVEESISAIQSELTAMTARAEAAEAALEAMRKKPTADDVDDLARAIYEDRHKRMKNIVLWEELDDYQPHARELWLRHAKAAFASLAARGK